MVRLSNKAAIAYRDELKELKKYRKELDKEFKKLQAQIEDIDEKIWIGERVSEVYEGIALHHYGGDTWEAIAGTERGGRLYHSYRGWYGVSTWTRGCGHQEEKTVCNPGYDTREEAAEKIKIWIVKGIRPNQPPRT